MAKWKGPPIVKALLRRFLPRDSTSELEFSQAIMRLQMEPGEGPSVLFSQIADLSNRYGIHNHPEQQVIAVIMNALPMEYRAVLAAELRNRERALTLDEVEDCLENYQRQVHPYEDGHSKGPKSGKNSGTEITLFGVAGARKGKCWKCGQSRHQKKDCPQQNKIEIRILNRLTRADDVAKQGTQLPSAGRIRKMRCCC
jgi:hypothetical protein